MKPLAVAMTMAVVTLSVAVPTAWTAPEPSEVSISWQLDVHYEAPKAIEVLLTGRDAPRRFWYMRYTVTNRTGRDRIFVPECVLYTDTGQVVRAGRKVPSAIFRAIKKTYNDPLLKDQTGMTGKVLQGEDNAKDGVAIWTDFDAKAGAFDIFIGGLSGETAEIKLPRAIKVKEIDADGKVSEVTKETMILSKTLQLRYSIPGESRARLHQTPKLLKKKWVMR